MPKKNDLSAFKSATPDTPRILEVVSQSPKAPPKETRGRKRKSAHEKESELVGFKITKSEKNKLLKRAGLIPLGTYLKHLLRENTDIFD